VQKGPEAQGRGSGTFVSDVYHGVPAGCSIGGAPRKRGIPCKNITIAQGGVGRVVRVAREKRLGGNVSCINWPKLIAGGGIEEKLRSKRSRGNGASYQNGTAGLQHTTSGPIGHKEKQVRWGQRARFQGT